MPDLTSMLRSNWERGRLRTATVTAVSNTGRVDLSWQGSFVPNVPYLGWYSPTVNDVVQVMVENGALLCLGTLSAGGAGGLGPNLLPNPSFELGSTTAPSSWTDFWSSNAGHQVRTTTTAHSGGAAALFDVSSVAAGTHVLSIQDPITVDPGITYRCGAWFKANASDPTHLTCITRVYTASDAANAQPFGVGAVAVDVATTTSVGTNWVEVAGTRTIPAGHTALSFWTLAITTAGFTVSKVYADDASLRRQT